MPAEPSGPVAVRILPLRDTFPAMRRSVLCALAVVVLASGCGSSSGKVSDPAPAPAAAKGSALPGPQPTPKGAEAQTVTGTWGQNAKCVFLTAGYGPISPSFPQGWTFDAATKTIKAPDGSARGKIGQKVAVRAVSLDAVPKAQVLCAGSAIQVLAVTVPK